MSVNGPLAPALSYLAHPEDLDVWSNLRLGASHLQNSTAKPSTALRGTKIEQPKVLGPPAVHNLKSGLPRPLSASATTLPATPPPNGFLVGGSIAVFGNEKITGKLTTFHGPPPAHLPASGTKAVFQHLEIESVSIGDLLPDLSIPPFDKFKLNQVRITHQSQMFDVSKAVGWHIEADIIIDESFGIIHDFLSTSLGLTSENLRISMYAYLGIGHSWNQAPVLSSFSITGMLGLKSSAGSHPSGIKLSDTITLTRIGIRLLGTGSYILGPATPFKMEYGFEIFGELAFEVSSLKTPLLLDYIITELEEDMSLAASLQGNIWQNAFGLGINLEQLSVTATFPYKQPLKGLDISFSALLDTGNWSSVFSGTIAASGAINISATIANITLDGISNFFSHQTGDSLIPPNKANITLGSATLSIATEASSAKLEWSFTVDHFSFDQYTCNSASITRTLNGIDIIGQLSDTKFGDFTLESAQMHATLQSAARGRDSNIFLSGKVLFPVTSKTVDAAVHFFKTDGQSLEWTICCELEAPDPGKPLYISKLFEFLQGTPFDQVALNEAAFVIASSEDAELPASISQPFPIRKGAQVCAVMENVLDSHNLLPSKFYLNANWTDYSNGVNLDLLLPSITVVHLSKTIVTDPIFVSITTKKPFQVAVVGGVKIPIGKGQPPLAFTMALAIAFGASPQLNFSASLDTDWTDPFGISNELVIQQPCTLQVDVNLYEFVLTGLPAGAAFHGGLKVGGTKMDFAVTISDDPDEEMLKADVKNLAISDLLAFTSQIFDLHLPSIPDFMDFLEADMYFSTGVMIANTYYPPGVSLSGTIRLFGSAVFSASLSVLSGQISVKGSAQSLSIGPLKLNGRNNGPASLDLEMGSSAQSVKIDACITFLGLEVDLFLDAALSPSPAFSFDFLLKFTDLLLFQVNAQSTGDLSNAKDMTNLDFKLHAEFEQHILDYVRDQALKQFEAAKAKVEADLETAKATLDKAEKDWQAGIDSAQSQLNTDYANWQKYSDSVHNTSGAFITKYNDDIIRLQGDIDAAGKKLTNDVRDAQQKLTAANVDRASKMQSAEADVNKAKAKWDSDVQGAENTLHAAQQDFSQRFGNAEQDIGNAEDKVNSLQSDIDSIQGQINNYEGAHWYEVWKKAALPGLYIAKGGVETAKGIADGVLEACKAVVEGADYITVQGAIPAAEKVVEDVEKAGDTAFQAAQAALDAVDKVTAEAIALAQTALDGVQKVGQAAVDVAKGALDTYKKASDAALELAQKAIDGLLRSAEWMAYQAGSLALSTAKAATHAVDIAKAAVTAAEDVTVGALDLTEEAIKAATGLLNIRRIELDGSFHSVINKGESFTVSLDMTILGEDLKNLSFSLDLTDTTSFITSIFKAFVSHPSVSKPAVAPTPGPVVPPG